MDIESRKISLKKLSNILLNNKLYLLVFYLLNVITQSSVFLCGDDYMYGTFGKDGIIKNIFSYYNTGNGRWLVNIIDSFILKYDRYIYILINPLMICFVVILLSKIANKLAHNEKNKNTLKIAIILFSSLNILMTREVIYWITGSMNYLFPAFMFLLSYYFFLEIKDGNLKYIKIFPLVTFITGASVEQFGLMITGILTIEYLNKIIKHKKFNKYEIIAYITCVIGLASIIIAPGNFVRVEDASSGNQSIITGIMELLYSNFYSDVANKYILLLSIYIFLYLRKRYSKYKKIKYISVLNITLSILTIIIMKPIISYINFILTFYLVVFICYKYLVYDKDISLFLLFIAGIGSQIMLLISTIWGFRICFSMYIIVFIFILYLANNVDELGIQISVLVGIININLLAGIILGILFVLFKHYKVQINNNIFNICILILIIINIGNNALGYYNNSIIHKSNITQLTSNKQKITLNKLSDESYSWTSWPLSKFHENYMKQYYSIPKDKIIVYKNK